MGTSIGHRLRDARHMRGVTLSHAAQRTGVHEAHLLAVEQDDLAAHGIDHVRADGIIHTYARYLDVDAPGLSPEHAVAAPEWRRAAPAGAVAPDQPDPGFHPGPANGGAAGRNGATRSGPDLVRPGSNGIRASSHDALAAAPQTAPASSRRPDGDSARGAGADATTRRAAPLPFAVVGALVVGSIIVGAIIGVVRWRGAEQAPTETAAVLGATDDLENAGAVDPPDDGGVAEGTADDAQDEGAGVEDAAGDDPPVGGAETDDGDAAGDAAEDGETAADDDADPAVLDVPQSTGPPDELTMKLEYTDKVWVRVIVDGRNKLEGIMRPGAVTQFTAKRRIVVRVGVAEAVEYSFNGAWYGNVSSGYDKPVDVTCTLKSSCEVTKVG